MTAAFFLFLRFLIAACLYAFLAWAIYTLWRYLQAQSIAVQSRPAPELTINNLDNDELIKSFTISVVNIGRDPACEYVVADDTISSYHARLTYRQNQWWAEDLQSTNGTFLNDERLETPTVIMTGDELRLGKTSLTISIKRTS